MRPTGSDLNGLRGAIASGDPSCAMPALVALRGYEEAEATPLLLLGLEQSVFMIRSLACAGLGIKRSEQGWSALLKALQADGDANVRSEAANALASYGVERSWPHLINAFRRDHQWLVRCSILSALAEQPEMPRAWLLQLARLAIADPDGSVRVGGVEILCRVLREHSSDGSLSAIETQDLQLARTSLAELQADPDHRVVAAALNGLHP